MLRFTLMAVSDAEKTPATRAAIAFAIVFVLCSLVLLGQIGEQAKYSSKGKLFAQPAFWPAVSLAAMAGFGLLHAIGLLRRRIRESRNIGADGSALSWLRVLEYYLWFMAYVFLVPVAGYLPVTVVFACVLAWRLGYRRPGPLALAALMAIVVVVVFKSLLAVKIPGGAVYEYLPDAIRNFMIVNF